MYLENTYCIGTCVIIFFCAIKFSDLLNIDCIKDMSRTYLIKWPLIGFFLRNNLSLGKKKPLPPLTLFSKPFFLQDVEPSYDSATSGVIPPHRSLSKSPRRPYFRGLVSWCDINRWFGLLENSLGSISVGTAAVYGGGGGSVHWVLLFFVAHGDLNGGGLVTPPRRHCFSF